MKKLLVLLLSLVLIFSFAACGSKTGDKTEESTAITVTDMTGREVSLDTAASKVVVLTAGDCEILYAIGAGDTVVGRGTYCDYPDAAAAVPVVASGSDTNVEEILALEPDAVVMSTMAQTQEQIDALTNAGVKVIVTDADDIEGTYAAIRLLGAVTGHDAEAETVVTSMQQTFDGLAAKATGDGTETVYFEVSPLEYGLWTAGSNTFMNELAEMIGLKNAFADVDGWGQISAEQVIERDPDYIVTITMYFGEGPTPVEEIKGRDGWQNLKAVVNDHIYNADSNSVSRPGPRLADAAAELYDFVYGTADSAN